MATTKKRGSPSNAGNLKASNPPSEQGRMATRKKALVAAIFMELSAHARSAVGQWSITSPV